LIKKLDAMPDGVPFGVSLRDLWPNGVSSAPGDTALTARHESRRRLSDDETYPKHSEETTKMRLLLALVGLTIGFVVPVFAQEKEEVNSKILAAIQANDKAYDDAFNKHDAAGIAALFRERSTSDKVGRWRRR
jgi:hypothetical protein